MSPVTDGLTPSDPSDPGAPSLPSLPAGPVISTGTGIELVT